MKIAVVGTQCVGKSTYIKDFLKKWTMYKTPEKSYRDMIKEKNLPHSSKGTEETQSLILNFLIDQAVEFSKEDNVILDRCVLDVLAYSSWLNLKGKLSDELLDQQRILIRETLKLYDVLFFLPITKFSPVDLQNNGFRDIDPIYREEIDFIFKAFQESYHKGDGRIFPKDDTPPIIEIYGSPEERIAMTEFYITADGKSYGEEQNLLNEILPASEQTLRDIQKDMGHL